MSTPAMQLVQVSDLCYKSEYKPSISVPSSCVTDDVTLVDGGSQMEGRVEVCRGGVWGAVYGAWNYNTAQVICRQLGFPSECEFQGLCTCHGSLAQD